MKNLSIILGLLAFIFAGAAFSSEETATFSFNNSGVTIHTNYPDFGAGDIKIRQGKLVEKDPSGKVVQKFNLKSQGGTWSPVVLTDGIYTTTYDSNSEGFGLSSQTTVHTGVLTTSIVESVLCPQCSGGSTGTCQNYASKICKAPNVIGRCPRRFQPCTETVVRKTGTLMFSLHAKWKFQNPDNTLHFEIKVDTKKGKKKGQQAKTESISIQDHPGFLDVATNAVIKAADGAKRIVNIKVNIEYGEKKNTLSFEFPSFGPDEKLQYN